MSELQVIKFVEDAQLPTKKHDMDAGFDLYALKDTWLTPGIPVKVETGIGLRVPPGFVGLVLDRSSMASKGIMVSGGVIDALYSGEILVVLTSTDTISARKINKGDRIAQLVILETRGWEIREVKNEWASQRGANSFGSSGR